MPDGLTIARTQKKMAEDIEVGMVLVANLSGDSKFDTTLYTVITVHELRDEDETVTVTLRYNYDGLADPSAIRVIGIHRHEFVTVV